MGLLSGLVGGVKDRIKRAADKVKDSIRNSVEGAKDSAKDAAKDVKSSINESIRKAKDSIKKVSDDVSERIGSSRNDTKDRVSVVEDEVGSNITDSTGIASERSDEATTESERSAKELLDDVKGFLTGLPGVIIRPEVEEQLEQLLEPDQTAGEFFLKLLNFSPMPKSEILKAEEYQPLQEQLETLGLLKDMTTREFVTLFFLSISSFVTRLSNEPLDRSITYDLNKTAPNAIAPAADLVRFELREVFRPKIRPMLLEEPASDDFKQYMEMLGYNSEWSDNYWAAHWELPSAFQGFEMFQRLRPGDVPEDVEFTLDDLNTLLKQQDILPFYRDRLTSIAYLPITRVDIRRMRASNVFKSEEEVQKRYQDIGYSPEDAALLARWTEVEMEPEEKVLNRTFIEKEYQEDRFTVDELTEGYIELGYRQQDVDRLVDSQVTKKQRATVKEAERRTAGARTDKLLPPSSALKAYEFNLIDRETAGHKLIRYGYDLNDTEILLRIKEIEKEIVPEVEVITPVEEITTPEQVLTALRAGSITEEQGRVLLTQFGVSEIDIARLLAIR